MDSNNNDFSRIKRYGKNRKSTALITRLSALMAVLIVILIGVFVFGDNNEEETQVQSNETQKKEETENQNVSKETEQASGEEENNEEEKQEAEEASETLKIQAIETNDSNVKEAYTANWKAVGTVQSEPHTVVIEQGTQEWSEIMQAVSLATEIPTNELVAWWVTRGGEQEVITTVSDKEETKTFRVYLHWEESKGYRPDKVEVLKENDQKYRY